MSVYIYIHMSIKTYTNSIKLVNLRISDTAPVTNSSMSCKKRFVVHMTEIDS